MKSPVPKEEVEQRLATLRQYDVLDTPPEQAFDDLTLLAAQICQVPMALVSLVDENRQWFKSRVGMTATETLQVHRVLRAHHRAHRWPHGGFRTPKQDLASRRVRS